MSDMVVLKDDVQLTAETLTHVLGRPVSPHDVFLRAARVVPLSPNPNSDGFEAHYNRWCALTRIPEFVQTFCLRVLSKHPNCVKNKYREDL